MIDLDLLMRGAIDMHVHHAPDTNRRRIDALEAAKQAQQAGMRAIVLKCHSYPTAPLAILINQLVPSIKIFGSICLDYEIGGLNLYALETSARLGARVVWMPTFSSFNSRGRMKALGLCLEGDGFSIIDANGRLVPEIPHIVSMVKQYDMVLASGHLSPSETFALMDEVHKNGINRMVITHPLDVELFDHPFSIEDLRHLTRMGAFVELTCVGLLPTEFRHDPTHTVEIIKALGADHCIMSTDLGQYRNPLPVEGMRLFIAALLQKGVEEKDIEIMVKFNPARLLGLE